MLVYFFIASFYLSDDRQYIYRSDIGDFYGFIFLRIACGNDNCHSCYEEMLYECLQVRMIICGHKLSGCFNEGIVYLVMVFLPLLMTMPL